MAPQIQIRTSLQIQDPPRIYQSPSVVYTGNLSLYNGPTPGVILVPTTGVVVNLSQLARPGPTDLMNLDATHFVTVGVYDGARFYPLLELPPLVLYPVWLTRYLNQEFLGTSTGTNADINQLMMIADTAACRVLVNSFDA